MFNHNIYNLKLPIEPQTIIDAGANVGLATLFFKIKYPKSKIVSLEIESGNVEMIHKNLKGLKDIEIVHKGLFNKF